MKTNQTRTIGASTFSVRCWMLSVAILATAASALAGVHYVDVNCTNATPPYTNWTTAATNIQDAVDAAVAGDQIVTTNGGYWPVVVSKPLTVRSVSGPQFTVINGYPSVRCVWLTNGASLWGFTLSGGRVQNDYGGGAYGGTLNNCILVGNSAHSVCSSSSGGNGGGAAYCTLNNCTLSGNSVDLRFDNCYVGLPGQFHFPNSGDFGDGGGAYHCTLNNCTLTQNSAINYFLFSYWNSYDYGHYGDGGGAAYCTLNNCILAFNSARDSSGSLYDPSSYFGDYGRGGGADRCALFNCVVFNNSPGGDAYPSGYEGWKTDPLFVGGSLRLQSNSPCINAGNNSYVTSATDLDGNPRIAGGTVDIGAYEFQAPVSKISYAWLQQYGLLINAATDTADPDGDGMNNWQEWICGTDPTNALSVLRLLSPAKGASGVNVTWQSVNTRSYFLERSTDLGAQSAFLPLATNIPGQTGTTTFTDTNAIGTGPWFFRVGVSTP